MEKAQLRGVPVRRRELRYGSPEFRAASDLARHLTCSRGLRALIGSVARDPALARVLVAVWGLPVVHLRVGRADAARWAGRHFPPACGSIFSGRRAQAVLELPDGEAQYLAGHSKQAVRTNVRRARELGVTCQRMPSYEAWFENATVILHGRPGGPAIARAMGEPEAGQRAAYYVAHDADGTPLAFAGVALFGDFGVLFLMLSHAEHPNASWARFALHTFLAVDLGVSGVGHLLVGSALRESDGNQYFQHLLGYRACNLRVKVTE